MGAWPIRRLNIMSGPARNASTVREAWKYTVPAAGLRPQYWQLPQDRTAKYEVFVQ